MDQETESLVRLLRQPHRVQNNLALFRACERASALIEQLIAEKNAAPAKEPAQRRVVRVAASANLAEPE